LRSEALPVRLPLPRRFEKNYPAPITTGHSATKDSVTPSVAIPRKLGCGLRRGFPDQGHGLDGCTLPVHELQGVSADAPDRPVILAAPHEPADEDADEDAMRTQQKAGRAPVPDELYVGKLRKLVTETEGVVPSIREVARQLSIGQDRARRLVGMVRAERSESREE
jgi:hypothetical protein